ncbi:LysR family transcriptional regulator [uncultured Roseibium sp.]|uniref:LysR family transcriptional regulator n=1 Tax=uncultured Roseibium sp. TaxID=1936171 RepID=UPI002629F87C|nr:LysR family transcriptional regulator [uncultured Roseibium sp.]
MKHWTELRTAMLVAQTGTVSAAASALGVHRATVNRHIEVLEHTLGTTLFHRHARGYALTDAGRDMLEVTSRAEDMFKDLEGRNRNRASLLSGELTITALGGIASLIIPAIKEFHIAYPKIAVEFVAEERLAKLEHGEAHVAFRIGPKPDVADYVVLPFYQIRFGLYASRDYIERFGYPENGAFEGHEFVGAVSRPTAHPYSKWMRTHVPQTSLSLQTSEVPVQFEAVCAGLGLGFLPEHEAQGRSELVEILPPRTRWTANVWIVTHVDLHRTAKIQAFLRFVRKDNRQNSN